MTDTQSVFDSMLQDMAQIRKEVATVKESQDYDALETHLSERIATLFENAMEATAVQTETLNNLNDQVQQIVADMSIDKKRFKNDLSE